MADFGRQFLLLLMLFTGAASELFGQNSGRTDLVEDWIAERQENPSIYQATPVTQVVPTFNTITYAVLADLTSATINTDKDQSFFKIDESLKLSGYSFAPHVSISLKKIGLGFAGEVGKKNALYYYDGEGTGNQDTIQESFLDYRGFGLNAYYILPQPFGKKVKPSLTIGYSALSAKHSVSTFVYQPGEATIADSQRQLFNYNISRHEIGLNIGIQLLKKFSLIPWVNHEYIDTSAGSAEADKATTTGLQAYGETMKEDIDLFWHANPRTRYGIDFVVRVFGTFDIHFGGILGAVASLGPKNEFVEDSSYSLSLSLDQKGN